MNGLSGLISLNDLPLFGGGVVLILIIALLLSGTGNKKQRLRIEKIQKRLMSKRASDPILLRKSQEKLPPLIVFLMRYLPNIEKLEFQLQRAGFTINPRQYALRCVLAFLIISVLFPLVFGSVILGISIAAIVTLWLPFKIVTGRAIKRQKAFLKLFPEALDLIVRGLRSGLPVSESIKMVAQELAEPVGGIFTHASNTMKLGVPMEKALHEVARRLEYTEFNFFVISIVLQRETGGNLSEILNNLSDVLRKRFTMQMKVKAMTSEARASGMIVGALPFFVAGAVWVMSPDYIMVLFTDPSGHKALMTAGGFLTTGMMIMKRMARFEI